MSLKYLAAVIAVALSASSAMAAPPSVEGVRTEVFVDVSDQSMAVYRDGVLTHIWPVSTARPGKATPRGSWSPNFLSRNHRSSRYNNAPMPFAIFYDGHYAIHGTDQVNKLGSVASSGCVRLSPENAKALFDLVSSEGKGSFTVTVLD